MKKVLFVLLLITPWPTSADEKLPDSMPVNAARDLDYAVMKSDKVFAEEMKMANERAQARAKREIETIKELSAKYKLELFRNGQPWDTFDAETGKITRHKK